MKNLLNRIKIWWLWKFVYLSKDYCKFALCYKDLQISEVVMLPGLKQYGEILQKYHRKDGATIYIIKKTNIQDDYSN